MERPRKVGAWKSGKDLAYDEVLPEKELELGYAGKHDRWNGYDPAEYKRVMERYEQVEALRQEAAAAAQQAKLLEEAGGDGDVEVDG